MNTIDFNKWLTETFENLENFQMFKKCIDGVQIITTAYYVMVDMEHELFSV